ncbi:hypothetical protein AA650_13875 [Anabaena sp. WA102]|uniref:hypothetical protein n=1 Tax=Anabaena sp. WA102 TaxID=1647413 RepID=UPI0006AC917B|nr:hypothetical protein [Anabaena sp. WA102]ALB41408.1 hypothetical protein AA650_13875 [Anabaena sp. WA102]
MSVLFTAVPVDQQETVAGGFFGVSKKSVAIAVAGNKSESVQVNLGLAGLAVNKNTTIQSANAVATA